MQYRIRAARVPPAVSGQRRHPHAAGRDRVVLFAQRGAHASPSISERRVSRQLRRGPASFAGRLFAWCCRLLGTPVAPFTGENVPPLFTSSRHLTAARRGNASTSFQVATVRRRKHQASVARRHAGRSPARLPAHGARRVRARWRAALREQRLLLRDRHAAHRAARLVAARHDARRAHRLGNGRFRFTMRVRHRWLGEVFYQTGASATLLTGRKWPRPFPISRRQKA